MASLSMLGKVFLNGIVHQRCQASLLRNLLPACPLWDQERNYAARKGKRVRMRKEHKKRKDALAATKKDEPFVPYHILHERRKTLIVKKRSEVGKKLKEESCDNVYSSRYYKWQIMGFEEAVTMHRETHHPTMINEPDALINVHFELNMRLQKKNKYVDKFRSLIAMPHKFPFISPRRVLVICNKPEEQEEATAAGAGLIGSTDLIPKIEAGDIMIEEYHYIISTPDLLTKLVPIRGLLKQRFPTRQKGTLSFEIGKMIDKFSHGIEYQCQLDQLEKEYGTAEITIGRLAMPAEQLEENFKAAVEELCTHRPVELGPFIRRAYMSSPPSIEKFSISCERYMPKSEEVVEPEPEEPEPVVVKADDDDDDEDEVVVAK